MVSYWKLDESSGTIATDSVGTNDGTLVNGPVWTSGQVDGALSFDGVDDYVLLPDIELLLNPFTICAWVNIQDNTLGGNYWIFGRTHGNVPGEYNFAFREREDFNYALYFQFVRETGTFWKGSKGKHTNVPSPMGWHFYCASWDGVVVNCNSAEGVKLYIDGELQTDVTEWSNCELYPRTGTHLTAIGVYEGRESPPDHQNFAIDPIDEVAIFNRALTAEEIQQLYQNGLNGLGYEKYITVDVEMIPIPGGTFQMGDHHDVGDADELPVHTVTLDSFYMSKYEITNQQYADFLNSAYPAQIKVDGGIVYAIDDTSNSYPYCNMHSYDADSRINFSDPDFSVNIKDGTTDMSNHPMVEVSWYGSVAYCNWKSQQQGLESCYDLSTWDCDFTKNGFRLATEAEWEYAARGGEHDPYYRYPWGDSIDGSMANYYPTGDPYETGAFLYTTPVGYYDGGQTPTGVDMVNRYGLYDVAGNVWEWCNDWYDSSYYSTSPENNPTGPVSGSYRILRGGGWDHYGSLCRIAGRVSSSSALPGNRRYHIGIRVARDAEPTNTAPDANAGDDQTVGTGQDGTAEIVLDCSDSNDPDGDELTYTWYLEIATGCDPVIELPCGTYTLELIVNDGTVDSEPDYIEVTV